MAFGVGGERKREQTVSDTRNRALYNTSARQIPHAEVLTRATRQRIWTADESRPWCEELDDAGGMKLKADLPVEQTRASQSAETCAAVKRKPAVALADPGLKHRTPHMLARVDSLVRGGKRGCTHPTGLRIHKRTAWSNG